MAERARQELRGRNLACWCKPGAVCHAEILLEIANAPAFSDALRAEADPQLVLTKFFMQCDGKARREFLGDVKAANPQLWREVTEARE